MKALISPDENVYSQEGVILGKRVAQVASVEFPVALPMFWIDCPNDCVPDLWYYSDGQLYIKTESAAANTA